MNSRRHLREQRAVLADADSAWSRNSEQSSVWPVWSFDRNSVGDDGVDVERARRMHERADVIVVPGLAQADGRLDRADADDALSAPLRLRRARTCSRRRRASRAAVERRERALDPLQQAIAIGGQRREAGAGALGQRERPRAGRRARSAGCTNIARVRSTHARRQVYAQRAVERGLEPREAFEDFVERDHERRRDAHDVGSRDEQQQSRLAGGASHVHRLAAPRLVELAADPHAFAAQVARTRGGAR